MRMKIFVSYSRKDQNFLTHIASLLPEADHDLWWDKNIPGGEKWWSTIVQQVIHCDCFIYLLSNKSIISEHCLKEYEIACLQKKEIIPVEIEKIDVFPKNLQELRDFQIVDFTDWHSPTQSVNLVRSVFLKERKLSQNNGLLKSEEDLPIEIVETDKILDEDEFENGEVELFNYWIRSQSRYSKENTHRAYTRTVEKFLVDMIPLFNDDGANRKKLLSELPSKSLVTTVSAQTFRNWLEKLIREGDDSLINHSKPAIVGLAEMLVKEQLLSVDRLNALKVFDIGAYKQNKTKREKRFLTADDLRKLLKSSVKIASSKEQARRNYIAISLAICTMLKREEIVKLEWARLVPNYDKPYGIILNNRTSINLPSNLVSGLNEWKNIVYEQHGVIDEYSYIILRVYRGGQVGKKLSFSSDALWRLVRNASDHAGLGEFNLEDLRATSILLMYNAGFEWQSIQRILGKKIVSHYLDKVPNRPNKLINLEDVFLEYSF